MSVACIVEFCLYFNVKLEVDLNSITCNVNVSSSVRHLR